MLRPGPILQRGAEGSDVEGPPREEVAAAARAHDDIDAIFNEAMVSCILRAWASCNIGKLRGCTAGRIRICWPYIYRLIIHLRRQLRRMSLMQLKVLMSSRRASRSRLRPRPVGSTPSPCLAGGQERQADVPLVRGLQREAAEGRALPALPASPALMTK